MAEDTLYLTVDKNPNGSGLIAIMTLGSPQFGDENVTILTLANVKNMKAAKQWFKRMKIEQPWINRN